MGFVVQERITEIDQVETNIQPYHFPQTYIMVDTDGRGTKIRIDGRVQGMIVCPHAEIYIPHRAVAASIEKWMNIYNACNPVMLDARTT